MATLRDIKNRISGVSSIERITSAMKMVSFVKSKKVQKQAEEARPYNQEVADMLALISSMNNNLRENNAYFKRPNEIAKNVIIIVVGSDKGMCGSFNGSLFKQVDAYLKGRFQTNYPGAACQLITIGTKACDYYKKRNHNIIFAMPGAFQTLDFSIVGRIRELFAADFLAGKVDAAEIFYNKFVNVMRQEPTLSQVLPIQFDSRKIAPYGVKYFYEPDEQTIFDMLVEQYLNVKVWAPLLESSAAEQSARLLAMDKATQNAQELIRDLQLQYNNARQAAITTEMLEIVGGAEALKK